MGPVFTACGFGLLATELLVALGSSRALDQSGDAGLFEQGIVRWMIAREARRMRSLMPFS